MRYAKQNRSGQWVEVNGQFTHGEGDDILTYPPGWLDRISTQEAQALGCWPIVETPRPQGAHIKSLREEVVFDGEKVLALWLTQSYTVQEAVDIMWSRIKARRLQELLKGAPTPFGLADVDDTARINISGAVQIAQIAKMTGDAFVINWTMLDNTIVELTADQMITLGVLAGRHVATLHGKSQVLRNQLLDIQSDTGDLNAIFGLDLESIWSA
jgi:hypothetical protein